MQIGFDLGHGVNKWKIKSCEYEPKTLKVSAKNTLNENFSMAMYALVHKLLQVFLKRNQNPEEIVLWNKAKSNSKSKINHIIKWRKTTHHSFASESMNHIIIISMGGKNKKEKGMLLEFEHNILQWRRAWMWAWKEIITWKKKYALQGAKDTFTSHKKGCH